MVLTYIRPDADDTDGTWTNESDNQTNLFASIDETSFNDADYIKSAHAPNHDICKIRLSDPSGLTMRPATVHYRFRKRGDVNTLINLDVSLLQGATEIAKWSETSISTSYVDGSQALTLAQFNAITDFTNLYLQFDAFSQWWITGATIDLSFQTGLYYDSGAGGSGQAITSYLTCTRSSVGFARTIAGTLTSFATNTLRITDYGLLIEEARTNSCTYSQAFSGNWTLAQATVADNQTAAPDGTTTAGKVTEDSQDINRAIWIGVGGSTGSGKSSISMYAKAAERNFAYLGFKTDNLNRLYAIIVDLTTGAITETHSSGTITNLVTSTEAMANGWWRLIITMDTGGTGNSYVEIGPASIGTGNAWASNRPSYQGDGSSGIYVWGGQCEFDNSFPTSYIATSGGTAGRASDANLMVGNLNTLVSALPNTVLMDALRSDVVPSGYNGTLIGDQGPNQHYLYTGGATFVYDDSGGGGNLQANFFSTGQSFVTGVKVASAHASGARSVTGAGITPATDTVTAALTSANAYLGTRFPANEEWNAYIRRATFFNSKLADATLQTLTAP